jgi:ABC-type sugar transport system ATPase subunit
MKAATRLLALDEPTSSLTTVETERLFGIIGRLRADGVAVIYVSHRMNEIMRLADRVAVLRDGRLVAVRPIRETSEAELVELMVGRPLSSIFDHQPQIMDELALEVRGLTTSWLSDVTFNVRRGEVVGLAGLAGAGRSELAKALFGLVPRTSGSIAIYGHETVVDRPSDAVKAGIAYLPEDRKREGLVLMRSVRENISLASLDKVRRFRFIRSREERALVTKTVEGLRIKTPSLEQEVSKLSGGNQQKVLLARSLVRQPKVLILDEPTRGIDVATKTEIYRLIERLTADGVAVLFISSELLEVIGVSDRILVMQDGRITGELEASGASEKEILRLAMFDHLSAKGSAAA